VATVHDGHYLKEIITKARKYEGKQAGMLDIGPSLLCRAKGSSKNNL
jgi:hypothetical protein